MQTLLGKHLAVLLELLERSGIARTNSVFGINRGCPLNR
jgi:hypothetical protein